ncbi:MAG: hypothetical protein ACHQ4F_02530 [Candidatus Dormibacteria bacterium]
MRVAAIAGGALGVIGIGAITVVARRRRDGPITGAAKRLPAVTHDVAVPVARTSDRWLMGRTRAATKQRDELVEALSIKIAEHQAQAQRRANPLWRRAAATALETGASAGVAALVRRAMSEPASRAAGAQHSSTDESEPVMTRHPEANGDAGPLPVGATTSR